MGCGSERLPKPWSNRGHAGVRSLPCFRPWCARRCPVEHCTGSWSRGLHGRPPPEEEEEDNDDDDDDDHVGEEEKEEKEGVGEWSSSSSSDEDEEEDDEEEEEEEEPRQDLTLSWPMARGSLRT